MESTILAFILTVAAFSPILAISITYPSIILWRLCRSISNITLGSLLAGLTAVKLATQLRCLACISVASGGVDLLIGNALRINHRDPAMARWLFAFMWMVLTCSTVLLVRLR
jgi:hypothetical protein